MCVQRFKQNQHRNLTQTAVECGKLVTSSMDWLWDVQIQPNNTQHGHTVKH